MASTTGRSQPSPDLQLAQIFLSASIPSSTRWPRPFDPLEIAEAVLAAVRAVIAANGVILYGGHPAIAPLIMRVAAAFQEQTRFEEPRVVVYQSALYEGVMPLETRRLAQHGLGRLEIVPAFDGELPLPGKNTQSLAAMRDAMLDPRRNKLVGAIFVGGMDGVLQEYRTFRDRYPNMPAYPLGGAGGMAADLSGQHAHRSSASFTAEDLRSSRTYASLLDLILLDITEA